MSDSSFEHLKTVLAEACKSPFTPHQMKSVLNRTANALRKQQGIIDQQRDVIRAQGEEINGLRRGVIPDRAADHLRIAEQLNLVREQLADEHAVQDFSRTMIDELNHARGRGKRGWRGDTCSDDRLIDMLLKKIRKGGPGVWVHIANYAMMLYQRGAAPAHLVEKAAVPPAPRIVPTAPAPSHIPDAKPWPTYGTAFTAQEWEGVKATGPDGRAVWASPDWMSCIGAERPRPDWATHVILFGK